MQNPLFLILVLITALNARPNLIITTDIGQDPDDQQSMVRLLHYANEFNLLGIVANADANYKHEAPTVRDDILHELISAYAAIEDNLRLHADGYPSAETLHCIVKRGCSGNGVDVPVENYIGKGKDTEGSDWIIRQVDAADAPVYISVWGGACDLAQALWTVQNTRSPAGLADFIRKLRVYFIANQDSSNEWIIEQFPNLHIVLSLHRSGDTWQSSFRGMFVGGDMSITSREWLHANIIGVNPLSEHYPEKAWTGGEDHNPHMAMKEGDTPAWFFALPTGLNAPQHPEWGSWGGRFVGEHENFYRDAEDTVVDPATGDSVTSSKAAVFRWRPDFQNDFAARVQWGVKSVEQANHYPVAVLKGHNSGSPVFIQGKSRETVTLDASESRDPDGDTLNHHWFVYPEAGTCANARQNLISAPDAAVTAVSVPENADADSIHIILRITDQRSPYLTAYKRVILNIE